MSGQYEYQHWPRGEAGTPQTPQEDPVLRHSNFGTSGWIVVSEVDDHVHVGVHTPSSGILLTMTVAEAGQLMVNLRAAVNHALAKTITDGVEEVAR